MKYYKSTPINNEKRIEEMKGGGESSDCKKKTEQLSFW